MRVPACDDAPLSRRRSCAAFPFAAMLEILHRDDAMVVINKPSGLLVHRTALDRHETRFAVQLLRDQIGQRVWPVHRLDRGTSGILVFALDAVSAHALATQFAQHGQTKRYVTLVRGHPQPAGDIDHPLRRADEAIDPRGAREGAEAVAEQPALTRFRRLATVELPVAVDRYPTSRYALVEAMPLTGRTHQIRRHMNHIAHPVIGDSTHGKGVHNRYFASAWGVSRLMLACIAMQVRHPASGESMTFGCDPGADFHRLADAFGWGPIDGLVAAVR
jgi:tRNA pseudouridine65 synthase